MIKILIITVVMCTLLCTSIIFKPTIKIFNKDIGTYWIVALIGAIFLMLEKCITMNEVIEGLFLREGINPVKILILFLSMTYQSIFLDKIGAFHYFANLVLMKSKGDSKKFFLYLYVIVSILTIFTSNDVIILTFTPFICYFAKNAKINPVPFLITEFVAANTWSMALIFGNPTNIYLATSHGITFIEYLKTMIIPTFISGISSLLILYLIFRKNLKKKFEAKIDDFKIEDKNLLIIGLTNLSICILFLVVSSYIELEMYLITFLFALNLFIISTVYIIFKTKNYNIIKSSIKGLPWELVPFVFSMFIFITCIENAGLSNLISNFLENFGTKYITYTYGISAYISANLINNISMSVLYSSLLKNLTDANLLHGLYASIISSNLGALLSPIGALAGMMWTKTLNKHQIKFSYTTFIKYGIIISFPTLIIALIVLNCII